MIMFYGSSSFYRDIIKNTNVDTIVYESIPAICSSKSTINTDQKVRALTKKIQVQLLQDFSSLEEGEFVECTPLRELLSKCFPDMKSQGHRGKFQMYNVSELYNTFTELFPAMKLKLYIETESDKYGHDFDWKLRPLLQMWDFMAPIQYENYERPSWITREPEYGPNIDIYPRPKDNPPVLVFQNGGFPPIRKFDSISSETIDGIEYEKSNKFGEVINVGYDKYRLFGAVILQGTRPGKEGGRHYISYVRRESSGIPSGIPSGWFRYNDVQEEFVEIDRLPSTVFREIVGSKPEMYFYEKLN